MKPERIQVFRIIGDAAKATASKLGDFLRWIVEAVKAFFGRGNGNS